MKWILAGMFTLFAIVQWNDPDPLVWMSLYEGIAVLLVVSIFKPISSWIYWTLFIVVFIWIISLLPEFIEWVRMGMPSITASMKAEEPFIEYTREFLGLFIVLLTVFYMKRISIVELDERQKE